MTISASLPIIVACLVNCVAAIGCFVASTRVTRSFLEHGMLRHAIEVLELAVLTGLVFVFCVLLIQNVLKGIWARPSDGPEGQAHELWYLQCLDRPTLAALVSHAVGAVIVIAGFGGVRKLVQFLVDAEPARYLVLIATGLTMAVLSIILACCVMGQCGSRQLGIPRVLLNLVPRGPWRLVLAEYARCGVVAVLIGLVVIGASLFVAGSVEIETIVTLVIGVIFIMLGTQRQRPSARLALIAVGGLVLGSGIFFNDRLADARVKLLKSERMAIVTRQLQQLADETGTSVPVLLQSSRPAKGLSGGGLNVRVRRAMPAPLPLQFIVSGNAEGLVGARTAWVGSGRQREFWPHVELVPNRETGAGFEYLVTLMDDADFLLVVFAGAEATETFRRRMVEDRRGGGEYVPHLVDVVIHQRIEVRR